MLFIGVATTLTVVITLVICFVKFERYKQKHTIPRGSITSEQHVRSSFESKRARKSWTYSETGFQLNKSDNTCLQFIKYIFYFCCRCLAYKINNN